MSSIVCQQSPDPGKLVLLLFSKVLFVFYWFVIGIFGTVTAFHDIFNVLLDFPMDFLVFSFKILVFL